MFNKTMSNKTTNHLGSSLDKLAKAGTTLPSLNNQLNALQQATAELKSVLVDCLPQEILDNCWVVNVSEQTITLAVTSTTAANHITYMKQGYLKILTEQSTYFSQLNELKVIVAHINTSDN